MRRLIASSQDAKGKARPAAVARTRRRVLQSVAIVSLFLAAVGGGWWVSRGMNVASLVEFMERLVLEQTAGAGMTVQDILVEGRERTDKDALLKAIGLSRGSPIFAFSPSELRTRIETLPWVRQATVERRLPDTLYVQIEERHPMALWQNAGTFTIVGTDGEIIPGPLTGLEHLPLVVGEEAPAHAAALLALIDAEPTLAPHFKAGVWVAKRRWNVVLKNGIEVQLPETDSDDAWARLADYEKNHRVLEKALAVIDLRVPDRLVVRMDQTVKSHVVTLPGRGI